MGFLRNLKLWLFPLRMTDPDFGNLILIHISKWPERSFVARNGQTVLGIEVSKMSELASELVPQARIGQDLPVSVAFASLDERREECLLVVHGEECSAELW
jgi:hypothetical protein